MKKKDPFDKPDRNPSLTHMTSVTTQYRAWCDTQSLWISPDWTTEEQANADAKTHADMGHLVEVRQKIG